MIQGDGKTTVAATNHHQDHDDLAAGVQAAGEAKGRVGQADGEADVSVARDDLEEDSEDAVGAGVGDGVRGLDEGDEEQRGGDGPDVVGQLAAQVLRHEVDAALLRDLGPVEVHELRALELGRVDAHALEVHPFVELPAHELRAAPPDLGQHPDGRRLRDAGGVGHGVETGVEVAAGWGHEGPPRRDDQLVERAPCFGLFFLFVLLLGFGDSVETQGSFLVDLQTGERIG